MRCLSRDDRPGSTTPTTSMNCSSCFLSCSLDEMSCQRVPTPLSGLTGGLQSLTDCVGGGPPARQKDQLSLPWQNLNFLPLPQGQGSLRPTRGRSAAATAAVLSSTMLSTSPVSVGA